MFDSIREFYDELLLNWSIIQQAMAPLRLTRWQMFKLFVAEIHRDNPIVVKLVVLAIAVFWLSVIAKVIRRQRTGTALTFSVLRSQTGGKKTNIGGELRKSVLKVSTPSARKSQYSFGKLLLICFDMCRVLTHLILSTRATINSLSILQVRSTKSSASPKQKPQRKTTSAQSRTDILETRRMRYSKRSPLTYHEASLSWCPRNRRMHALHSTDTWAIARNIGLFRFLTSWPRFLPRHTHLSLAGTT